jgi:hypothetical protein
MQWKCVFPELAELKSFATALNFLRLKRCGGESEAAE